MDYEVGLDGTVRPVEWLPVGITVQRQMTRLGADYADAPADRGRIGVRDIALGQVALDRASMPKLTLGGGYLHRADALAEQGQLRASGAAELDLAEGWLKSLRFKKLYLRGLYELGRNGVDEFRTRPEEERDRTEVMHHGVGELRLAPTLTESAYSSLEYHGLEGTLGQGGQVVDHLTYWRLDSGAGSSIIPGLALRFDSTFWFGDDLPPVQIPSLGSPTVDTQRKQEANSTLSGVMDIFPGEWVKKLGPVKFNLAYTYSEQATSQGVLHGVAASGVLVHEQCGNGVDDDGDGLVDCADPECALADVCLLRTGQLKSHRVYGTAYWDTPGKLQAEIFGDYRQGYSDKDDILRSTRIELRSYVTWRPVYPSPITLRFDVQREWKRPDQYDGIVDPVEPEVATYQPALEWRRRWSPKWWHLAKLTLSHSRTRDLPHIRTIEDAFGKKGDLERLDYDDMSLTPSIEIRRRFEDEKSTWSFRPYLRANYKLQWGTGRRSRTEDQIRAPSDPGFADGSETSRTLAVSLGFIWVHSEHVFVDLDLTTSYYDCVRAPSASFCNDAVTFSPHILATARY
jgi:hypothetical protein